MSYPCRCRRKACERRQTIAMHPSEYVRTKRCKFCRKGELRVDRYRIKRENRNPCRCYGYSFPHARGRGYCEHNHRLTPQQRWERCDIIGARYA